MNVGGVEGGSNGEEWRSCDGKIIGGKGVFWGFRIPYT